MSLRSNLYSDQKKYAESIPEYLRARELDPDSSDVHYRLGQAYVRTGEKDLAQKEFEIYRQLREQHLSDIGAPSSGSPPDDFSF